MEERNLWLCALKIAQLINFHWCFNYQIMTYIEHIHNSKMHKLSIDMIHSSGYVHVTMAHKWAFENITLFLICPIWLSLNGLKIN